MRNVAAWPRLRRQAVSSPSKPTTGRGYGLDRLVPAELHGAGAGTGGSARCDVHLCERRHGSRPAQAVVPIWVL